MDIKKSKSNMKEGVKKEKTKTEIRKRKNVEKSRKFKKEESHSKSTEEDEDPIQETTKRNKKTSNKKQKLTNIVTKKKDVTISKKKVIKEHVHNNEIQRLSTRMSPNSLYHAIKTLSTNQRKMVTQMGFGSFLEMKMNTLPGKLSYYLVDKYESSTSSIKLKNGELKITKETVREMFGLPNKGVDFKELVECEKNDPLLVSWKKQFENGKFNNGNYLKKIRGSRKADDMFKLNFLTLFINTFVETEKMGSCKINFLEKLVHFDDVSRIDWCQYILDCLEKSKNKWRPNDKNCYYTGPVTLLMLAYVDRVVCEDLQLQRLRPFITEIDSEHLRMLEDYELAKGQFGNLHIHEQVENDNHEEIRDKELPFDENGVALDSVEAYCAIIERMYNRILESKKNMEVAIVEGLVKYPNNERLKEWLKKMKELFPGTTIISQLKKAIDVEKANESEINSNIPNSKMNGDNERSSEFNIFKVQQKESGIINTMLETQECVEEETIENNHGNGDVKEKRKVKVGQTLCSLYAKRVVEVKDIVQQDEQLVAQVIWESNKDKRDIIWETYEGYKMHLEFAQTLNPKVKVHSNVIDCWAIFLNKSEVYKSESSNSRLFFTTNALTDKMIDESEPQNFRYNDFKESLNAYINDITNKEDLTNIDLVFFPIVDGEKYYLICFNLKRCAFMIIDNKKNEGTIESIYGKRPRILQSFFCAYLFKVGHKKANKLVSKNATMVKMKWWQTENNVNDDGIFLMRHMESYMGDGVSKWDCGLEVESKTQETYLFRLRYKFLSKLMLSDFNIMKDEFLKELNEFSKDEKFARMKEAEERLKEMEE